MPFISPESEYFDEPMTRTMINMTILFLGPLKFIPLTAQLGVNISLSGRFSKSTETFRNRSYT